MYPIKSEYLANNGLCQAKDYCIYFSCSIATAKRMISQDRKNLGKKRLAYSDFYFIYGGFPEGFTPRWEKVAAEVSERIKTPQNGSKRLKTTI